LPFDAYRSAAPGTDMAQAYDAARSAAGPQILNATLIIPIVLIVAFTGLYFYMRSKHKKAAVLTTTKPAGAAYENL